MAAGSTLGDRAVLVCLFRATGGESWRRRDAWDTSIGIGSWFGVNINSEGMVVSLDLSVNNLCGPIPQAFGDLPALRALSLSRNHLTGDIPKELGNLLHLESLHLDQNQLSGRVPIELAHLPALLILSLHRNQLSEVPLDFLLALRERDRFERILDVVPNPLLRPPQSVVETGLHQAISWWEDIARYGEGTSNKLKMVLVGHAGSGKTTIVRNITRTQFVEPLDRTVGIEITEGWRPLEKGPLEISIWDFAGQADYYASHQVFLTKGSLFLLVVDLRALFVEAARGSGGEADGDPQGRVYRWLEMLHLRVPGAAVALVGTHTDAAEFAGAAQLDQAVNCLEQLVTRYRDDKAKEIKVMDKARALSREEDVDGIHRDILLQRRTSSLIAPQPLFIHDKVFKTSRYRDSTKELVEWIVHASMGLGCPEGFHFPAVGATIPQVWIDANLAMEFLMTGESGKQYVTWRQAIETFVDFMSAKGIQVPDPEKTLLTAMRHREAEGGVLLSLEHDPPRIGETAGMLYLDPTWLIEVIRRLTDHNLVDTARQDTIRIDLRRYCDERTPGLKFDSVWAQHRSYRTSGTLDREYLRYLWLHRQLDSGLTLDLNPEEFNGVLETMVNLLVMYRVPTTDSQCREFYVVPARFPEYGDNKVLENRTMGLGDAVVRVTCSFGQGYSPPGIIGRFLAFANAHIKEARECWQHGAHVIWTPGSHDVLVYEGHCVERGDSGSVTYPGLVLCVKGNGPEVREVLDSVAGEVRNLLKDKMHGYPGLFSESFGDTEDVRVSDVYSDLRKYLESRLEKFESLVGRVEGLVEKVDTMVERVARVTSEILEAFYLAAEEKNKYPRLLVLKPERDLETDVDVKTPQTPMSPGTACVEGCDRAVASKWMLPDTWNDLINNLMTYRKYRLVFMCEHDKTEVRCGPDGNSYPITDPPTWMKGGMVLLQVSFYALRLAVGMVSHVDLPMDDLLAALANSATTELIGAMATTSISSPSQADSSTLGVLSTRTQQRQRLKRMQEDSYAMLCQFMQTMESPSSACCGLRSRCRSCGSTPQADCVCVSWEEEMVRVGNGKGGLVWVKKYNESAYIKQVTEEAERCRAAPHA